MFGKKTYADNDFLKDGCVPSLQKPEDGGGGGGVGSDDAPCVPGSNKQSKLKGSKDEVAVSKGEKTHGWESRYDDAAASRCLHLSSLSSFLSLGSFTSSNCADVKKPKVTAAPNVASQDVVAEEEAEVTRSGGQNIQDPIETCARLLLLLQMSEINMKRGLSSLSLWGRSGGERPLSFSLTGSLRSGGRK